MGLLDDAIREHLELKRRHGADEAEVSRLEHEALGPVRGAEPRHAAPAPAPEPAPVPEPEEPAAVAASELERDPEPAPVAEEEVPRRVFDAEPWLDEPDEVPQEEVLDHRAVVSAQPTQEFTPEGVEPDLVTPDEDVSEDVLEETPDFLQETPEHDRLWFEQKPPRDFDFDH